MYEVQVFDDGDEVQVFSVEKLSESGSPELDELKVLVFKLDAE